MQEIINNTIQAKTTNLPSKGEQVHTDCKFYTMLNNNRCISGTTQEIIDAFFGRCSGFRVIMTKEKTIVRKSEPLSWGDLLVTQIKVNDKIVYSLSTK